MRIVRAADPAGTMHLLIQGPGEAVENRQFADVLACMNHQAELERSLVSQGYTLERFTSDRRGRERDRRGSEGRRIPHLFL